MLCRIVYRQTVGSTVVQEMVFNDQQKLDNEAAAITPWMKLINGNSIGHIIPPCANESWLWNASKNH